MKNPLNIQTLRIDSYGLSRGIYCSIIYTYPTSPIYFLHSLQGQFIGFQDFTLLLNSKRVSQCCISDDSISQIFGPKYVCFQTFVLQKTKIPVMCRDRTILFQ